jgi:hypothetical protein
MNVPKIQIVKGKYDYWKALILHFLSMPFSVMIGKKETNFQNFSQNTWSILRVMSDLFVFQLVKNTRLSLQVI